MSGGADPFALGGIDPLIALWAERLRLNEQIAALGHRENVEEDERAILDEIDTVDAAIGGSVPTTMAGAVIQLQLLRHHRIMEDPDACDDKVDQIAVNIMITGLERLGENI